MCIRDSLATDAYHGKPFMVQKHYLMYHAVLNVFLSYRAIINHNEFTVIQKNIKHLKHINVRLAVGAFVYFFIRQGISY